MTDFLPGPADGRAASTVAIVCPHYAPRIGGLESYARQVAVAVRDTPGLRPLVVTTSDSRRSRLESHDGIEVVRFGVLARVSNTPVGVTWPLRLRALYRRYGVRVVNTHSPVPVLADFATAVAGNRPVVATYHAGSMMKGDSRWDGILAGYERHVLPRVFARAAAVVAVSPTSLAHSHPGSELISPGVDVERFTPGEAPRSGPRVLYVGRLDRTSAWKGVDVLIRAFAELAGSGHVPDARLRVVGDGDARPDLEQLAATLGIGDRVEFPGFVTGAGLVGEYRDATVSVLPSLTAAESFGMTLVEAMACGTPVIGSRVGGIPHVIEDDVSGLLVSPGDVGGLAKACERILTSPRLRTRLGAAGRERAVDRFSWAGRVRRYVELFVELSEGAR